MAAVPEVYTLLVEVGRRAGDGLPEGSTGAALVCYAAGRDEAEACARDGGRAQSAPRWRRSTSPPTARWPSGSPTGTTSPPEERALMERAAAEDAVIVAQATPFHDPPGG